MQSQIVRIFKAESIPYKNKKTGVDELFNSVSMLYENELVEASCSKAMVDYIIANKDRLHNIEVPVTLKPRGYILENVPGFTTPV